ncbi:MAG: hypothetical protein LBG87_04735 [Spirochaetaceae bacterium]|jgi:hypothetical protein|nr:hypothetical protein [Spirochaetaceae bacterium]
MFSPWARRFAARCVFVIGLLFMFLGSAFLLGTIAGISRISVLSAFFFVILGAGCAVLAIKLNKRSLYLFFAGFFMLLGFFLFLSALTIIPISFSQAWPLISVFSGLALFPAGWRRYGSLRSRYVVPSIAFVALGSVLLVFSFNIVPFSFAHFILNWWPLLVALAGILLVLISVSSKTHSEDAAKKEDAAHKEKS